ncbi:cytochrome c biogenesis protein ResB [Klugiella xanthotipulae]|uniref:Cytochrome c biogenesis protein n=1 Tax=Klugiella xanthotipulae TaxID=244735 RepID=A0A543HZ66_9MICO|nr:cytochrome c biogenesis protein ResB [Klugiella xanthotipulae]TQM63644.1 cytochrome c biogenesis protein [Klugiella xanthotipulae]
MTRPSDHIDSTPGSNASPVGLGFGGYLRWFWRQLTSMRVAILLLLLLAVAAIPGSILPQRGADPNGVTQYQSQNPDLFKVLDAFPIQAFDVYSSVWFSAIYLLLFVSLIGCVLPRTKHHWQAMRSRPPRTPSRLGRMAGFTETELRNDEATAAEAAQVAEQAVEQARGLLKRQRYRTEVYRQGQSVSVSAERGYLRETGNLVFHGALVGVLITVGLGGGFGYQGQRTLVEGETNVNALIDYDSFTPGRFFDDSSLPPFSVRLDTFDVTYVTPDDGKPAALGQATDFTAHVTVFDTDGTERKETVKVNQPLRINGTNIYLLGNGYAPTITVRNAEGVSVFHESVPFLPQGADLTSLGVLKIPYGLGEEQVGMMGFFYPTQVELESGAYSSNYPDLINPLLTLDVFTGDLGINDGVPQSVYSLNQDKLTKLTGRGTEKKSLELRIGDTVDLPNGLGTVTLDAVPRFVSFDLHQNPAQGWVLFFALLATTGLLTSLFIPRRRVWVKATPVEGGVRIEYAALARGDDPTLEGAVADLVAKHRESLG